MLGKRLVGVQEQEHRPVVVRNGQAQPQYWQAVGFKPYNVSVGKGGRKIKEIFENLGEHRNGGKDET